MENSVPLVIYRDGDRVVIGEATVSSDGVIKGHIKDAMSLDAVGIGLQPAAFSIAWTPDDIDEIDRCARAYGYEVGRRDISPPSQLETLPDNPFLDPKWREHIK